METEASVLKRSVNRLKASLMSEKKNNEALNRLVNKLIEENKHLRESLK